VTIAKLLMADPPTQCPSQRLEAVPNLVGST
jgi:hypothetical protein